MFSDVVIESTIHTYVPMSIRAAFHFMTLLFATLMAYPNYKRADCTATNKVAQYYADMEKIGKKACEKYLGEVTKTKVVTNVPTETLLKTVVETHAKDKPVTVTKLKTVVETSTSTVPAPTSNVFAPSPSTVTITVFNTAATYGMNTNNPTLSKSTVIAGNSSTTKTLSTTVFIGVNSTTTTTITSTVPIGCMESQDIQGASDSRTSMSMQSIMPTSSVPVWTSRSSCAVGMSSWATSGPKAQNSIEPYSISWFPESFKTSYFPTWQSLNFESFSTPHVFPDPSVIVPRDRTMDDVDNETYDEELSAFLMLFARDKDWKQAAIDACRCLGWPSGTETSMVYTTVKGAPKTASNSSMYPFLGW